MRHQISRIYLSSLEVLWALALIGLPLTTFPLLASLSGASAIVAPFSAAPLLIILLIWLIPSLFIKRLNVKLPIETWPIFLFILAALLSSAVAAFYLIPSLKSSTPLAQELRALYSLAIGVAVFLVCSTWPTDSEKLRKSLKWITIGGILVLLWTFTQVYYILAKAPSYPQWVLSIQNFLVIKPAYFFFRGSRTSGLAYEASWFAHQLVILYIPLWLAVTIERKSSFNFRILKFKKFEGFSIENILLPVALFEFLLTTPRIALVSLFLIFLVIFGYFNLRLIRKILQFIADRNPSFRSKRSIMRVGVTILLVVVLSIAYIVLIFGAVYLLSQRDWRLALFFAPGNNWSQQIPKLLRLDEATVIEFSAQLAFLERVVYWLTGWHIFNSFPFLGVGLGNSGFFFPQQIPAVGWSSYEIRNLFYNLASLPNIKGFWVRLLAETGILGFYIFLGWYYLMGKSALLLHHSINPTYKIIAIAGLFSLVAFIGEGFSIDSFAMPYLWVTTGLVAAGCFVYRRECRLKRSGDQSS